MYLFPHDFLISSMDFVHLTIELFAEHTEEITHSNLSLAKNNLKSLQKLVISANSG